MADRQLHNPQQFVGPYNDAPLVVTQLAADVANKERAVFFAGIMVLAHNTEAVTARNVTISSVENAHGRTNNETRQMVAGEIAIFGPYKADGWINDGELHFEADSANVKFAVLKG